MNSIYELKKKATPGPLHMKRLAYDDEECVDDGLVLCGDDGGVVAHAYGNPEEFLLLAHCRNHVVEALEALKEIDKACPWSSEDEQANIAVGLIKRLARETIANLETVADR